MADSLPLPARRYLSAMNTDLPLFLGAPNQTPPDVLYSDEHVLEPCSRCGGTGREDNPFPTWDLRRDLWDPKCRQCDGAGKRLIFVGAVRDA